MEKEDPWEDLGERKKPEEKPKLQMNKKFPSHEDEEMTALRRAKNLEAIFVVFPEAQLNESDGRVEVKFEKFKFDFWPASNTYYSYSKGRYGHGITQLCEKIMNYRLEKEKL